MIAYVVVIQQEATYILNRLDGPIHLSPLIKRDAYLLRDRWRISTEPNAQVIISFR